MERTITEESEPASETKYGADLSRGTKLSKQSMVDNPVDEAMQLDE